MQTSLTVKVSSSDSKAFWTATEAAREWVHCHDMEEESDLDMLITDDIDLALRYKRSMKDGVVVVILPKARRLKLRRQGVYAAKDAGEDLRRSLLAALTKWFKSSR